MPVRGQVVNIRSFLRSIANETDFNLIANENSMYLHLPEKPSFWPDLCLCATLHIIHFRFCKIRIATIRCMARCDSYPQNGHPKMLDFLNFRFSLSPKALWDFQGGRELDGISLLAVI